MAVQMFLDYDRVMDNRGEEFPRDCLLIFDRESAWGKKTTDFKLKMRVYNKFFSRCFLTLLTAVSNFLEFFKHFYFYVSPLAKNLLEYAGGCKIFISN